MSPRRRKFLLQIGRHTLSLGEKTRIMAVINRTPDSFSDGGLCMDDGRALACAEKFLAQGANIIDVGGESTRPGAARVGIKEELRRTISFVAKLAKRFDAPISIDTTKSQVASAALDSGASLVNDVSGLRRDKKMARTIARYNAGCVIMHAKGTPRTMQRNPAYAALMPEITDTLRRGIAAALEAGVDENRIIIDPGIGFGKTQQHNLRILKSLNDLEALDMPIMIGTSRKSFIGSLLGLPVRERLFGTAASLAWAAANGAHIVRVHDVEEMAQAVTLIDAIMAA